jgi:hypothetical protein
MTMLTRRPGCAHRANKSTHKDLKSPTEDDRWNQTKKAKKKQNKRSTQDQVTCDDTASSPHQSTQEITTEHVTPKPLLKVEITGVI